MKELIGKLVKIIFEDDEKIRAIRGYLISVDDFITIKTNFKTFAINKTQVQKIVEVISR